VVMSRTWQAGQLQPWLDLTDRSARRRRTGTLRVERCSEARSKTSGQTQPPTMPASGKRQSLFDTRRTAKGAPFGGCRASFLVRS
jgi:hypothetical protein